MSELLQQLNMGKSTTFTGTTGGRRVELGPDGPPYWSVKKIVVKTNRPGLSPVPSCIVYLDTEDDNGLVGSTYDGSRDESAEDIDMQRGQKLIALWTGGQAGDRGTLSVYGKKGVR